MTGYVVCVLLVGLVASHPVDKDGKWIEQSRNPSDKQDGPGTGGGVGGYHGVFRPHNHRGQSGRGFDGQTKVDIDQLPREPVEGFVSQDKPVLKPEIFLEGPAQDGYKPTVEDHSQFQGQEQRPKGQPISQDKEEVSFTEVSKDAPNSSDQKKPNIEIAKPIGGNYPNNYPVIYPQNPIGPNQDKYPDHKDGVKPDAYPYQPVGPNPSQDKYPLEPEGEDKLEPVKPVQNGEQPSNGYKPSITTKYPETEKKDSLAPVRPNRNGNQPQDGQYKPSIIGQPDRKESQGPVRPVQNGEHPYGDSYTPSLDRDKFPGETDRKDSLGPVKPVQNGHHPHQFKPVQKSDEFPLNPDKEQSPNGPTIEDKYPLNPTIPKDQYPSKPVTEDKYPLNPTVPKDQYPLNPTVPKDQYPSKPVTEDNYPLNPTVPKDQYPSKPNRPQSHSDTPADDVQVQSKDIFPEDKPIEQDKSNDGYKPSAEHDDVPEKAFPSPADSQPIVPEEPQGPSGSLDNEKPFGPTGEGIDSKYDLKPKPQDDVNVQEYPAMRDLCQSLDLKRFLTLVNRADMSDIFSSKGPITIFAPTDAAFSKLPVHVYYRLTRDNVFLKQVLQYHIIEGVHPTEGDGFDGQQEGIGYYQTKEPALKLFFNSYGSNYYVNGFPITKASQKASNGMIHVVDNVLYPVPSKGMSETMQSTSTFTRFYALAKEAGLFDEELKGNKGAHTIFLPSDAAFAKLPRRTLEWLSFDKPALRTLLLKHIVPGAHFSSWVTDSGITYKTMNPEFQLEIKHDKDHYSVNGVRIGNHDIVAQDGVIHSINEVLFSKDLQPKLDYKRPSLKRIYPSSPSASY